MSLCVLSPRLLQILEALLRVLHVLLGMCQALEIQEKGMASFSNGTAIVFSPAFPSPQSSSSWRPVCLWTLALLLVAREAECGEGGRWGQVVRTARCPARVLGPSLTLWGLSFLPCGLFGGPFPSGGKLSTCSQQDWLRWCWPGRKPVGWRG